MNMQLAIIVLVSIAFRTFSRAQSLNCDDCWNHHSYNPVCGNSGQTYAHECVLRCSGEWKECDGECPCPKPVPRPNIEPYYTDCNCNIDHRDKDPVCTYDNEDYDNKCKAECDGKRKACDGRCPCGY